MGIRCLIPQKSKIVYVLTSLNTSLKGVHFIADLVLLSPLIHMTTTTIDYTEK